MGWRSRRTWPSRMSHAMLVLDGYLDGCPTDGALAGKEYKDESDKNDVTKLSHAALPGSLFLNQVPLGRDASYVMALVRCCRGNERCRRIQCAD